MASLREDGDAVFVTVDDADAANVDVKRVVPIPPTTSFAVPITRSSSIKPKFYFSAAENGFPGEPKQDFHYQQWKIYVQGMAIPLKFRSSVGSVKQQVESGPTLAVAPGLKYSWNTYGKGKNFMGSTTSSKSVAFGALVGIGTVDINAKSTQDKVKDVDASKNAIIPVGFHLVFGIYNFNLGAALGWDIITGPNNDQWNYKGKMWTGVIVGIDIIK